MLENTVTENSMSSTIQTFKFQGEREYFMLFDFYNGDLRNTEDSLNIQ